MHKVAGLIDAVYQTRNLIIRRFPIFFHTQLCHDACNLPSVSDG